MSNDSGLDLLTGGGADGSGDDGNGNGNGRGGRRRAEPPRRSGRGKLLAALVVIVVLCAGGFWAFGEVRDRFGAPDDYSGEGSGEVTVQIAEGANGAQIAQTLYENDVVASTEAFYRLSMSDQRAQTIQPGTYQLRQKMSAKAALDALVDRANRVESRVTVPEGTRVDDIVQLIAENTDITAEDLEAALADPAGIGLPEVAQGNPEGYLFPETYFVEPDTTATQLLSQMVQQTVQVTDELGIEERAAALGYNAEEIMTIASILEWEVNNEEDFRKAARVIYNRLDVGEALRMDSTVHYVSGRRGDAFTTDEERNADSPYNTYRYPGLPPGPIGSPGKAAIEAALNPAEGEWMYFVADVETGETTFTNTYAEHQQACRDAGFEC
ncbi:endolytic transglycosylase MltG [Aeromicrobium phragmitis]|uniref:Endolytic murein transglycosylase n=1 Tax=Aeromicrobium phragmitis TaxID=2478914 RepID=A0A3L8PJF6_9ACTN|nr:endolytic transglycosylase MltG [Aeromicrobium phragmitis]RLV55411.1 endolytic transglycosylase MltG [Aeromicrobium phragmitis]